MHRGVSCRRAAVGGGCPARRLCPPCPLMGQLGTLQRTPPARPGCRPALQAGRPLTQDKRLLKSALALGQQRQEAAGGRRRGRRLWVGARPLPQLQHLGQKVGDIHAALHATRTARAKGCASPLCKPVRRRLAEACPSGQATGWQRARASCHAQAHTLRPPPPQPTAAKGYSQAARTPRCLPISSAKVAGRAAAIHASACRLMNPAPLRHIKRVVAGRRVVGVRQVWGGRGPRSRQPTGAVLPLLRLLRPLAPHPSSLAQGGFT